MNIQNELITCPLNPIHKVKRSKMDYHLIRCKQQFGPENIEICPYNSSHVWLKGKGNMQKHLAECPSRGAALQGSFIFTQPVVAQPEVRPSSSGWGDEKDEDWGAGPAPEKPLNIQIGKSSYAYKPPAVRRQIRQDQLEAFKARQANNQTTEMPPC